MGYKRLRDRVTAELAAYRVDGREAHLAAVAQMLPPSHTFPSEIRAPISFLLDGWVDLGIRSDQRGMRRRNPGFRVRVRRCERAEIGLGARYGFRIFATSRRAAVESVHRLVFRTKFVNRFGKERNLAASNETAAY